MPRILFAQIKKRLQQSVEARFRGLPSLRRRIREGESALLSDIAAFLDAHFEEVLSSVVPGSVQQEAYLQFARRDALFRERAKQLLLQAVMSEPLCPPVFLLPDGYEDPEEDLGLCCFPLPKKPAQAVVVEHLAHAANEVYPLMVDAYVHDLGAHREPARNFAMVHVSWLTEDLRARRALFYHADGDELIEKNLPRPLRLDSILFLCISPEAHRQYGERARAGGIRLLNPPCTAALADDKYLCFQRWSEAGVKTPPACLISARPLSDRDLPRELESGFRTVLADGSAESVTLMLQPNRGTEGRGTRAFSGPADWGAFAAAQPDLLPHAQEILSRDDLLLRRGVGGALWCERPDGPGVYFDLRFNVIDGRVESGYLMAAAPGAFVSSPGQGGRVLDWNTERPWPIRVPGGVRTLALPAEEGYDLREAAERAATCFPGCRLAGVDIRPEWDAAAERWVAWVLDLNPRPAGLSHSRYIDREEPGVTMRLWKPLI